MARKQDCELNARARWDRWHLYTIGTKLRVDQTEAFDAACAAAGITRYEALRRFCLACIKRPDTIEKLKWQRGPRKPK